MVEIVYQDRRIVVAVKPSGVLSTDEPGGAPELLRAQLGTECIRTVHRLDAQVAGLMVFARSARAASILSEQVRERRFGKEYLAVVHGEPPEERGVLRDLLGRDGARRMTYVAREPGRDVREAELAYETVDRRGGLSLVRIRLHTGRMHQIRVQFASRGLPLLGDGKYGREKDNRAYGEKGQALCSWRLRFVFDTPAGALEYLNGKSFRTKTPEFVEKYFPAFAERMKT